MRLILASSLGATLLSITACAPSESPAERHAEANTPAGKVGQAAHKVAVQADKAGAAIGRQLSKAAHDAKRGLERRQPEGQRPRLDLARRRFFVPEIRRNTAELQGSEAEHLVRVLRVEPGQIFEISDNRRVFLATVETARKSLVSFTIVEEVSPNPIPVRIHLYAALFKFDRFEWLVEKATECGVASLHPVQSVRSEVGLAQASVKRRARWDRIALEASQQSRRDHLPEVGNTLSFGQALNCSTPTRIFLDEEQEVPPLLSVLSAAPPADTELALLLGPEGGWTDEERSAATSAGWRQAGLGPVVLRAETAGIAALAVVLAMVLAARTRSAG